MEERIFWWQAKEKDSHDFVFDLLNAMQRDYGHISSLNLQHYRSYNDENTPSLSLVGVSRPQGAGSHRPVTFNVIKSMCDTVQAKIAKNRPRCAFLTSGGDFSQQRKGKLLEKFCDGQFYRTKLYEVAPEVFMDSCVFGTGVLKVYEHNSDILCERVFPEEIMVSIEEAKYKKPRSIFQVKAVPRDVLTYTYPEYADRIKEASTFETEEYNAGSNVNEMVQVVEAWHLPSIEGAPDGRHVICLENLTLLDENYEHNYFPFVFLRWSDRLLGFWGQGLAEQLMGIQLEINTLLQNIQQQMHLAKPKVFLETGSQIADHQINNEEWGIVDYIGQPPVFYVPKTVSGEVFSHLDRLFNRAYQISGVSELAAMSKKPAGLESAVALREFSDIETERFMIVAQNYESMFMEAARQMIDLARRIAERGDDYEVVSSGDKYIEQIKWKDIDLREEQYVMKIWPTSLLPQSPAGKLQKVIELAQSGIIQDPGTILKLLDYPDIESVTQYMTADQDEIDMLIENMVDKGKYVQPEPYSNLALSVKRVQQAYLRAKINNAPDGRLALLRRYIDDCMALMASMAQAAQPQMTPEGAGPALPPEAGGELPPEAGGALPPEIEAAMPSEPEALPPQDMQ